MYVVITIFRPSVIPCQSNNVQLGQLAFLFGRGVNYNLCCKNLFFFGLSELIIKYSHLGYFLNKNYVLLHFKQLRSFTI